MRRSVRRGVRDRRRHEARQSIEAGKVLAAIATTDFNGLTGHIAFDDKGDLKGSTITLYDFKDKHKNVLDVVKQ